MGSREHKITLTSRRIDLLSRLPNTLYYTVNYGLPMCEDSIQSTSPSHDTNIASLVGSYLLSWYKIQQGYITLEYKLVY